MLADFNKALLYCLQNEQGFSNRKEDHGGPTNKGITTAMFAKFRGRLVSVQELENISQGDIEAFYEDLFWKPLKVSILPQSIATAILDTAINQGQGSAIKLAQEALGKTFPIFPDGVMGPATLSALTCVEVREFIFNYVGVIQDKYAKICTYSRDQLVFLEGWLRRSRRLFILSY